MSTPSISPFSFEQPMVHSDISDCLPSVLRELAAKAHAVFGLPPSTITAAGLAHLAAAIGRSSLLNDGTSDTAPGFNFVAVSDEHCEAGWLSAMGRGWTDDASSLRKVEPKPAPGSSPLRCADTQSPGPAGQTVGKEPQDKQPVEQMSYMIQPVVLKNALMRSPDHAVTLLQGAEDSMFEWTSLQPSMQRHLTSLLSLSWQGKLLKTGPRDPFLKGSLTCIWQAQCAEVRRTWNHASQPGADTPPPLLLFGTQGNSRRFPVHDAHELAAWRQHVRMVFLQRLSRPADIFPLPFVSQAEEFSRQLMAAVQSCPSQMQPWLRWTPGLLPRIMNLLFHDKLLSMPTAPSSSGPVESEEELRKAFQELMNKALRLTTWLLQAHHTTVRKVLSEPPARVPSDTPDNTDKEGLPEVILRRVQDAGPLSRRELQRSFHQMSAQERDEALQTLKTQGRLVETADGKLALPA